MTPENTSRVKKIVFMIVVVAMALAAGASGAALVANSLVGSLQSSSVSVTAAPAVRTIAKPDATKVGLAAKGSVVLYRKKTGAAPLDKVYLPGDIHDTRCMAGPALLYRFTERDLKKDEDHHRITRYVERNGSWVAP